MLVSGRVSTLNCTKSNISRVPWAKAEGLEYPSPAVNGRRQDDKDRNLEVQKRHVWRFFFVGKDHLQCFLGVIKVIIAWWKWHRSFTRISTVRGDDVNTKVSSMSIEKKHNATVCMHDLWVSQQKSRQKIIIDLMICRLNSSSLSQW